MKMEEEHEEHENHERWLVTYADMITLLMVFFIVMYSMSSINSQKFQKVAQELRESMGGGKKNVLLEGEGDKIDFLADNIKPASALGKEERKGAETVDVPVEKVIDQLVKEKLKPETNYSSENSSSEALSKEQDEENLHNVEKSIKEYIQNENLAAEVSVSNDSRGTVISFKEALLFQKSSADVFENGIKVLDKIAVIVGNVDNNIRVEGFTDDLPIHTAKFNSNWELGAQRAINVGKILIGDGVKPARISCLSYGEFRPTVPNTTEANRGKNRKVDIVLIYKSLEKIQP